MRVNETPGKQEPIQKRYSVYPVRTPPMASPGAALTGAPAEMVTNAMGRMCEGGKVRARIPSWNGQAMGRSSRAQWVCVYSPLLGRMR